MEGSQAEHKVSDLLGDVFAGKLDLSVERERAFESLKSDSVKHERAKRGDVFGYEDGSEAYLSDVGFVAVL